MSRALLARFALLALPVAILTVGPAAAPAAAQVSSQSGVRVPPQDALPMRFRGMDANNDGVISRNEWRGSLQSFRVHDWNRDNVLSGDELRMSNYPSGRTEPGDYDPEGIYEIDEWTPQAFANLDRNRDQRITTREWPYALETFRRVDRNGDNVISRAEFLGTPGYDDDRGDRFDYLDADNNGRIERDEWHGSADAFDWLDRNRDGVLNRREVVGNEARATAATQFNSLDYNRNGVISRDEWRWSRGSFDQRDVDRNGVLSRQEFAAAGTPAAPGPPPAGDGSRVIIVSAAQEWTDSGIVVRAGDLVTFNAEGTVRLSSDPNDAATPAGSVSGRHAANAPVRSALAGALVMRIDNAAVQFAGNSGSFTAPASGRLYLGVNDDHMPDNSGEFRVTLTVRPR